MLVETVSPTTQKPLAFDMRHEWEKTERYGEPYRESFLDNAHYYGLETFARKPIVEYYHEIENDGSLHFSEGGMRVSAADRILLPYFNRSMPDWYRQRARTEYGAIRSLENKIRTALPGDRFVEFSPAPFDVPASELAGTAFGTHSFARTYEVVKDEATGRRRLLGKAHLNYLTQEAQAQLFTELTGQNIDLNNLLGAVGKLDSTMDITTIERIIETIPEAHKVPVPENSPEAKRRKDIEAYMYRLDPWLESTFLLMLDGAPARDIVNRFQDWEKALQAYVKDGTDYSQIFSGHDVARMLDDDVYMTAQMRALRAREYKAWENCCGGGSGFSGSHEELLRAIVGYVKPEHNWEWTIGDCIVKDKEGTVIGGCGAKNVDVGPVSLCRACTAEDDARQAAESALPEPFKLKTLEVDDFFANQLAA